MECVSNVMAAAAAAPPEKRRDTMMTVPPPQAPALPPHLTPQLSRQDSNGSTHSPKTRLLPLHLAHKVLAILRQSVACVRRSPDLAGLLVKVHASVKTAELSIQLTAHMRGGSSAPRRVQITITPVSNPAHILARFLLPHVVRANELQAVVEGVYMSHTPGQLSTMAIDVREPGMLSLRELLTGTGVEVIDTNPAISALQLQVVQQFHPDNCGFHTSHNAILLLHAFYSPDPVRSRQFVHMLIDHPAFWCTFNCLQMQLKRANLWDVKLIEQGLMNDFFSDYLLPNSPEFLRLGGSAVFTAIPSLAHIPVPVVRRCADVFSKILSSENISHAFLLGSMSHWVAVVAHKAAGQLELVFLDSANKPVLSVEADALDEVLRKRLLFNKQVFLEGVRLHKEYADATEEQLEHVFWDGIAIPGVPERYWEFPPFEYRLKLLHNEVRASKQFLDVIFRCCTGTAVFSTLHLDSMVEEVLHSFEEVAWQTSADGSRALVVPKSSYAPVGVEYWVTTYTRPATIRSDFVDKLREIGPEMLSEQARARLLEWTECVTHAIDETPRTTLGRSVSCCSEGGTPQVVKLETVLTELRELLVPSV